ncbi:MAG TPA: hypothetical protein VIY52_33230 [Streptosporangiaceae bacterium]
MSRLQSGEVTVNAVDVREKSAYRCDPVAIELQDVDLADVNCAAIPGLSVSRTSSAACTDKSAMYRNHARGGRE